MNEKKSPRQELAQCVGDGSLRYALERMSYGRLSPEALDLAIKVIDNYCAPRGRRARKAPRQPA